MEPVGFVNASLSSGITLDQVAHSLIVDYELAPIRATRALREDGDMALGAAKEIVHRNLPIEHQAAAELLWDQLVEQAHRLAEQ
jgi:hypothetical protein